MSSRTFMKIIGRLMIGLSVIALLFCGGYLAKCYLDYNRSIGPMTEMRSKYVTESDSEVSESDLGLESQTERKKDSKKKKILKVDWKSIQEENANIIAWIDIPNMGISYPVVQGEDNSYYLSHTVEGKESLYGAIFLNCENSRTFSDSHNIIYGHNMKDGSMFHNLNKYGDRETFLSAPDIYINSLTGKTYRYRIFSVYQTTADGTAYRFGNALKSKEYKKQVETIKDLSEYDTGTEISDNRPFITLITCNGLLSESERTSVHAILEDVDD